MRHRVCFGCVTDANPRYQRQAVLLLASLRALAGEYADADFFLCVVGRIHPALMPIAAALGTHVVEVQPLSMKRPAANKLRFLLLPELEQFDYAVLLDCDTALAASPEGLFGGAGVRGRMAGARSVPPEVLAGLCGRSGLPAPQATYITAVTREPTPIYVNSGVIVVARATLGRFIERWVHYQDWLLASPELLPGCAGHTNQASLTLALIESQVAFEPLDVRFNFPVHRAPRTFWTPEVDRLSPVILHYDLTASDGHLLSPRATGARAAVEHVNAAWARWSRAAGRTDHFFASRLHLQR
jgi:hypothetical protein